MLLKKVRHRLIHVHSGEVTFKMNRMCIFTSGQLESSNDNLIQNLKA